MLSRGMLRAKTFTRQGWRERQATIVEVTELLKRVPNETYGEECNRLERAVRLIVEGNVWQPEGLTLLAYALMQAPADFDEASYYRPFKKAQQFLALRNEEQLALFRRECERHPRHNDARIKLLLRK